jgi:tellurite resistance protein TehA-like permease
VLADLTSHARGFSFLTAVAATNVVGATSGVVQGWWGVAWVLWYIGVAAWPILL